MGICLLFVSLIFEYSSSLFVGISRAEALLHLLDLLHLLLLFMTINHFFEGLNMVENSRVLHTHHK